MYFALSFVLFICIVNNQNNHCIDYICPGLVEITEAHL